MRYLYLALILAVYISCDRPADDPLTLHPDNPHYFAYRGEPLLLITSGEHYGALINLDFDYVTYLQTLAADKLNMTRVFTGAYVEPVGAFNIESNTLAPAPENLITPWARSETPGYANGGNKFDLGQWDTNYFQRLKDLLSEAAKRNIIVELTLFCPFYEDAQWKLSPLNPENNVDGLGPAQRQDVYTLDRSDGLLGVQEALVRKLVNELEHYDNLIYEICNEPYFGGVTMAWQHHIASLIRDAEKDFEHPHLISQNIANGTKKIEDPHPAVSVFNFHYAMPPVAVKENYHLGKAIGNNETGFRGNADSTYRKEAWAFILAGGALFNNLDYSFTTDAETGTFDYPATQPGGGSDALRKQLRHLRDFINGFNFIRMSPDSTVIRNHPRPPVAQALAEPGKQYAVYLWGAGPLNADLAIPEGQYQVSYTDPTTGKTTAAETRRSEGNLSLTTPPFAEDVAIRIIRLSPR